MKKTKRLSERQLRAMQALPKVLLGGAAALAAAYVYCRFTDCYPVDARTAKQFLMYPAIALAMLGDFCNGIFSPHFSRVELGVRTREEDLWVILSHLFERDSLEGYVGRLLFEAGFDEAEDIEKKFSRDVVPVCAWLAYGSWGDDLDEKQVVACIRAYKRSLIIRGALMLRTALLVSRKAFREALRGELVVLRRMVDARSGS